MFFVDYIKSPALTYMHVNKFILVASKAKIKDAPNEYKRASMYDASNIFLIFGLPFILFENMVKESW